MPLKQWKVRRIGYLISCSKKTLTYLTILNFCIEKGFIYVYKSGVSNVYSVNPDLIWSSWGKNKDYAQFPANFVLASSEQENLIKKKIKGSRKNLVDPRQGELFD